MKNESHIDKLKRLVGESAEIRKGNLSGKKKHMASKMARTVNAGTGRRLTKAESKFKTKDWPRKKMSEKEIEDFFKD